MSKMTVASLLAFVMGRARGVHPEHAYPDVGVDALRGTD